jgi:hypothetical protein
MIQLLKFNGDKMESHVYMMQSVSSDFMRLTCYDTLKSAYNALAQEIESNLYFSEIDPYDSCIDHIMELIEMDKLDEALDSYNALTVANHVHIRISQCQVHSQPKVMNTNLRLVK